MNTLFRKLLPTIVVALLILGVLPLQTASAAGLQEDTQPPAGRANQLVERKLQKEQRRYEAQAKVFERAADLLEKAQILMDRAAEKALDTSAVQAALAEFETAVTEAKPLHTQAGGLIEAHAGFDADGTVTDLEVAAETVEKIHLLLDQARDDVHDEREALQHALWNLFQAGLMNN